MRRRRRRSIDFDSLPEVENRELLALLATAATTAVAAYDVASIVAVVRHSDICGAVLSMKQAWQRRGTLAH